LVEDMESLLSLFCLSLYLPAVAHSPVSVLAHIQGATKTYTTIYIMIKTAISQKR